MRRWPSCARRSTPRSRSSFPAAWLQRRWDGDVLRLSGPGAQGTVTYEAGRLIGRADLRPPASLMRPIIEEKMASALRKVAG